jgi:hypothetical protein
MVMALASVMASFSRASLADACNSLNKSKTEFYNFDPQRATQANIYM